VRLRIDDEVRGLTVVALKQLLKPDQRLLDARVSALRVARIAAGALLRKRLRNGRDCGIEGVVERLYRRLNTAPRLDRGFGGGRGVRQRYSAEGGGGALLKDDGLG
jgi:hypothetical protein